MRWGSSRLNRDFALGFSRGVLKILGIKVEYEGLENVSSHQPCIYVANHQSGLDMATFGEIYPVHTYIIGKKELLFLPFFGIFFLAAGNLIINRKKRNQAVAGLHAAVEAIKNRKISIWIFPEGTRNSTGDTMLPFKKGAFHMAHQAQVPIVPFVCGPLIPLVDLRKRIAKKGKLRVRVLKPFYPNQYSGGDIDAFSAEVRRAMEEAYRELKTDVV